MANSKKRSTQAPSEAENIPKDKKMVDKVNQQMASDDSTIARLIGLGLVIVGVVFIVLAAVVIILSRRDPKIDDNIGAPTLEISEATNLDYVLISGTADKKSKVIFYLDDKKQDDEITVGSDGSFEYKLPIEDEGEYDIQAATVKGFPLKRRSEKSEPVIVLVDRTAPADKAKLTYDKTTVSGKVTVSGSVEPGVTVTILSGEETYSTTSDDSGKFKIKGVKINASEARFSVVLEDKAGNKTELSQKVVVEYPAYASAGDLNGDGVIDANDNPNLPEAAGEIENAFAFLFGNQLMTLFALGALGLFAVNSGVVLVKAKKN